MENQKKKKQPKPQLKNQKWLEPDGLLLIQGWVRDGLTNEQIAHNMGINPDTLYTWVKKFPEFADTLKETKEYCDRQVENALFQKALSGDTTAMIFWLKNRKRADWRDKQEISAEVDQTMLINVTINED